MNSQIEKVSMKNIYTLILVLAFPFLNAQSLYFPPVGSEPWETTDPAELNWCEDKIEDLIQVLEDENSKAFILLKDGKIVIEHYFDDFTQDSVWYWASAGKTLTAFSIGKAQEENFLSITDKSSQYLGSGWTSLTPEQEEEITIWNQLTMTSGLNDGVANQGCTDPSCLEFLANPGERWAYHNAPYTLLDEVIQQAVGQTLNTYVQIKVMGPIGAGGLYVPLNDDNVYFSKPRNMARFGLLLLANGEWDGNTILNDSEYLQSMKSPSQNLNNSYGYLTWLNGQNSFMLPSLQAVFPGKIMPEAPDDMYAAIGKNGQLINIVPSQNLVFIRMGNAPNDNGLVPLSLNRDIWEKINELDCSTTSSTDIQKNEIQIFPNPVSSTLKIDGIKGLDFEIQIFDALGNKKITTNKDDNIDLSSLPNGFYFVRIKFEGKVQKTLKLFKE